ELDAVPAQELGGGSVLSPRFGGHHDSHATPRPSQTSTEPCSSGHVAHLSNANLTNCPLTMPTSIDDIDRRLVEELAASPRLGVLELSRRLGVARGTVQARLDKLVARGIITGFGPDIDLVALGYSVLAFTTIEIAQGRLGVLLAHLEAIPEVIEA